MTQDFCRSSATLARASIKQGKVRPTKAAPTLTNDGTVGHAFHQGHSEFAVAAQ